MTSAQNSSKSAYRFANPVIMSVPSTSIPDPSKTDLKVSPLGYSELQALVHVLLFFCRVVIIGEEVQGKYINGNEEKNS